MPVVSLLPTGQTVVVTLTSVVTSPTGQFVTLAGHSVIVYTLVTEMVLVVKPPSGASGAVVVVGFALAVLVVVGVVTGPVVAVLVTGQTVTLTEMISVVTEPRGQFVTLGGHEVIVWISVE